MAPAAADDWQRSILRRRLDLLQRPVPFLLDLTLGVLQDALRLLLRLPAQILTQLRPVRTRLRDDAVPDVLLQVAAWCVLASIR